MRASPAITLLAAAAVLLGACSDGTAEPAPTPREERIAEVEALREAVVDPALLLDGNVTRLALAVRSLRTEPDPSARARLTTVEQVREDHVAGLRDTLDAAADLDLPGESPDAVAARQAWQDAVEAARELEAAAVTALDRVELLAGTDVQLEDLVASWEQPGSRRQQLERLGQVASRADALAAQLVAIQPLPPCSTAIERRVLAATNVAANTRELRDLVARNAGTQFDERRAQLSQDPYGLGERLVDGDAADAECWEESAEVPALETAVREALVELQAALNPPDLSTPSPGGG